MEFSKINPADSQTGLADSRNLDLQIKNQEDAKVDKIEFVRLKLKKLVNNSIPGFLYTNIMLSLSIFSCLEFIVETYIIDEEINLYLEQLEVFMATIFSFDWFLNFFIADHKLIFISSFFSMVDLLTVLPIYFTYGKTVPLLDDLDNFNDYILYVMFFFSTTRILRALRLHRKLIFVSDAVSRCLFDITLTLTVMILFNSAVMQYFDVTEQSLQFHDWMYFVIVTISTVGFGDISPRTALGRFASMAMIAFAIVTVPKKTNDLIEKMNLESIYARRIYIPSGKRSKHVIVSGDLKSVSLNDFFGELFHPDHNMVDLNCIILSPSPPSGDVYNFLQKPAFSLQVIYLQGTALKENDLIRAHTHTAIAVFYLTNKFSAFPDEEDAKSILQYMSVKRYMESYHSNHFLQLNSLQLIRKENRKHLSKLALDDLAENEAQLVICLNEIKMGIISKAVTFAGANTLIMNLISSFADDGQDGEDDIPTYVDDDGDDDDISENIINTTLKDELGNIIQQDDWLNEYQKGCSWEIYTTKLADEFTGLSFIELSLFMYQRLGIVLFALQIFDKNSSMSRVALNPSGYIIPDSSDPDISVEVFVIARNQQSSDLSTTQELSRLGNIQSNLKDVGSNILGGLKLIKKANKVKQERGSRSAKLLWSKLRKLNAERKKAYADSVQEKLHLIEETHIQTEYYMRKKQADIRECTIKGTLVEEFPGISNHVIIMGNSINNIYDLIRPLRAKCLGPLRIIIILYPQEFPELVWRKISSFEAIFVIKGSFLEESDVRRAGIFRASDVIILSDTIPDSNIVSESDKSLVDADAIFTYQCVKRLNSSAHVVLEINREDNIVYLGDGDKFKDYKFAPMFASGALFTTSLLDTIVCQSFFNPQIIKVLNQLISGPENIDRREHIIKASKIVAAVSNQDYDENEYVKSKLFDISSSRMYLIPIPTDFMHKSYRVLFKYLCSKNLVPLGLYRGTFSSMTVGPRGNTLPYVYTNPDKDVELLLTDKIYVLSELAMEKHIETFEEQIVLTQLVKKEENYLDLDSLPKKIFHDVLQIKEKNNKMNDKIDNFIWEQSHKLDAILDSLNIVYELPKSRTRSISDDYEEEKIKICKARSRANSSFDNKSQTNSPVNNYPIKSRPFSSERVSFSEKTILNDMIEEKDEINIIEKKIDIKDSVRPVTAPPSTRSWTIADKNTSVSTSNAGPSYEQVGPYLDQKSFKSIGGYQKSNKNEIYHMMTKSKSFVNKYQNDNSNDVHRSNSDL